MGDLGHDLQFGVFITPSNAQPEAVVELAVHAEAAGLDLVSFQDHPYQPRFLETWTLLSYVAARTQRVRLAPNVLSVPLRLPAVLARAAASLDLLSGGRVELGLGAGGFRDAIAAIGAPRLTAGESVDALEESIDIIRAIWDADEPRGVRYEGRHHRLDGAKRGPAPAHPIGLYIGAYKPRMLALTGRKGDGWWPSAPYLEPGDLQAGNAAIDAAARRGRPRPGADPAAAEPRAARAGRGAGAARARGRHQHVRVHDRRRRRDRPRGRRDRARRARAGRRRARRRGTARSRRRPRAPCGTSPTARGATARGPRSR